MGGIVVSLVGLPVGGGGGLGQEGGGPNGFPPTSLPTIMVGSTHDGGLSRQWKEFVFFFFF